MAERAGFSVGELDVFHPTWREEVEEIPLLRTRISTLQSELAEANSFLEASRVSGLAHDKGQETKITALQSDLAEARKDLKAAKSSWHEWEMTATELRQEASRLREAATCRVHHDRPAVCVGRYEGAERWEFACDECCGHGNEDGECHALSQASTTEEP